jgi:threonine synthase
MALSILPHLLTTSAKKNGVKNEIVILTATSGDTGKAAMAGFADVPGTKIIVFYPKSGVSPIQEKQMVTQKGDNTYVIGIKGNFDDAQTGVKKMFSNKELAKVMNDNGFQFSSANSINIGRLVPQVVYYVKAYADLLKQGALKAGEPMNVVVPTGNFGNILASYYAKQMGAREMEARKEAEMKEQEKRFKADAKEKEKEIIALKNQKLQYELRHKSQDLASSTMNLIRKNEILLEINKNLDKISDELSENAAEKPALIKRIKRMQNEIRVDNVYALFGVKRGEK